MHRRDDNRRKRRRNELAPMGRDLERPAKKRLRGCGAEADVAPGLTRLISVSSRERSAASDARECNQPPSSPVGAWTQESLLEPDVAS